MPTFLVISRHAPADCPTNNEKWRKATLEGLSKADELAQKHGVKIVGGWSVHGEHLSVQVFEGSFDAVQAFSMEPVLMQSMAYKTIEVKVATPFKELAQRLMQAQ